MRYPISKTDTALFLISCASAVFYISNWSNYSTCVVPIQIFLIAAPSTLILMLIIFYLFRAFAERSIRKYLDFLIIFIFTPLSSYLAIQGIIWQIIIISKSPKCPTAYFQIPWVWATLLFGVGFRYVKISYVMIKAYWRAFQERRGILTMQQLAEDGDYQGFNDVVWGLGEAEIDQKGLLPIDLKRFEKKYSRPAAIQGEDQIEHCPICLADFEAEGKVVTLPRCEHTFHSECVTDWLKTSPLCPMCRGNVRNGIADVESNWYRPPEVTENFQ